MLIPVGIGDRAISSMVVQATGAPRVWGDAEISFVQRCAAEVARVIVKAEVDAARADYVRRREELDRRKGDFLLDR